MRSQSFSYADDVTIFVHDDAVETFFWPRGAILLRDPAHTQRRQKKHNASNNATGAV